MSIRSELNNTKHYLRESRKAILGRGGEISEKAGLKDIPEAVWSIPADASLAFREDSEIAYEKVVPVGAEEYALVKSLGGMSYKALGNNNLCSGDGVYTYDDESHTQTISLGFYEAGEYFMSFDNSTLQNCGDYYLHNQDYSFAENAWVGGSLGGFNFTLDNSAELWLDLTPYAEMGDEGLLTGTLKNIMLCKADDADKTYKPYQPPILVSAKPTSLESRGANLISFPYYDGGAGKVKNHNGITFTVREDYGIHIKGKATADAYFVLSKMDFGEKTISAILYEQATNNVYTVSKRLFYNSSNKLTTVSITERNKDFDEIVYPMVNRGATLAPYKPYSAEPIDTKSLPEAVQSLDGWGLGIDAKYNNHIEWRNGRVIYRQMLGEKVFNGTEYFWINSHLNDNGTKAYQTGFTSLNGVAPLSNVFEGLTWVGSKKTYTIQNVSDGGLVFITDGVQTLDEFKAYLAEQYNSGNPVTVVYALAEPIETDITHLFTDTSPFLKVQGGGVVKANNERKEAVPSTLKYTIKVG